VKLKRKVIAHFMNLFIHKWYVYLCKEDVIGRQHILIEYTCVSVVLLVAFYSVQTFQRLIPVN